MTSATDDLRLAADFAPATYDDWRKLVDGVLKGAPFEKLVGKTYDGLKIDPIYPRARGAAPIAGRAAGRALADHAADRSSGCRRRQRAGAARSRERRQRADAGIRRRQRRLRFRTGAFGGSDREGSRRRLHRRRHLDRTADRSAVADGRDPPRRIHQAQRPLAAACDIRFGLDPIGACAVWGSSPYSWAEIVPAVTGGDQRPRGPGLQGPVRARRRTGDPRRRRIGSAGAGVRAGDRRRLSARDRGVPELRSKTRKA